MTPQDMATLYARAFTQSRPWRVDEFQALQDNALVDVLLDKNGFAIARTVAGETELLTIAVDPDAQGQGIGLRLTQLWLQSVQASEAFLDVAADNSVAIALYQKCGFAEVARRRAYYSRANAPAQDAIVMRRALP